jgi:hypothetical protein
MRCARFSKSYFGDSAFVVCPPAKNSRTYSAAYREEIEMPELEHLRSYAASSWRSGFGPPGFKLDGTTGEYHQIANKAGNKMNGQRLTATPAATTREDVGTGRGADCDASNTAQPSKIQSAHISGGGSQAEPVGRARACARHG